ncbi:MAG: WYL domain-containing protein [Muribaculaceae bacterium]|nr:WYL domain-containing protein [Bacteroidales bacterium]MDY4810527.1 WYL domain-containing protein [Muribaculaceae bacterium]
MARDLLNRYIWIIDTIRRYGRISRKDLDSMWAASRYANGESRIPRRTFYNYRQAIEELFSLTISCDPNTYEYFIAEEPGSASEQITNWLLNASATSNVLQESREIASRIMLEEVPSARDFLAPMMEAVRDSRVVTFDYHPYTRVNPNRGVELEPWFLRIYRQIWYVTGREVSSGKDKTYALDRISNLSLQSRTFTPPGMLNPKEYFKNFYGVMVTNAQSRRVVLRANTRQAKYLRALPLHHSQQEEINDTYSRFTYNLCLTDDLVSTILSMGDSVVVEQPKELRAMVLSQLHSTLDNYPPESSLTENI